MMESPRTALGNDRGAWKLRGASGKNGSADNMMWVAMRRAAVITAPRGQHIACGIGTGEGALSLSLSLTSGCLIGVETSGVTRRTERLKSPGPPPSRREPRARVPVYTHVRGTPVIIFGTQLLHALWRVISSHERRRVSLCGEVLH